MGAKLGKSFAINTPSISSAGLAGPSLDHRFDAGAPEPSALRSDSSAATGPNALIQQIRIFREASCRGRAMPLSYCVISCGFILTGVVYLMMEVIL